jgi:hypothetical protein
MAIIQLTSAVVPAGDRKAAKFPMRDLLPCVGFRGPVPPGMGPRFFSDSPMSVMKIPLRGKYAVGPHAFALVDASDYAELAQWKWKAKWNAARNHVYAVRNVGNTMLRMHRVILGLEHFDGAEVDHINHDSLDNRRLNLRVVTRKVNALNAHPVYTTKPCASCGSDFSYVRTHTHRQLCDACKGQRKLAAKASKSTVLMSECMWCKQTYLHSNTRGRFCSTECRTNNLRAKAGFDVGRNKRIQSALSLGLKMPRSVGELAEIAGCDRSTARQFVSTALDAGIVVVVARRGAKGAVAVYQKTKAAGSFGTSESRHG